MTNTRNMIIAFLLGMASVLSGNLIAQSITTLQADKIIANTSLTSPVATLLNITSHGTGNVNSNTVLGNNIFSGTMSGAGNTAIGSLAMQNATTDAQNTAIGVDAFNGCAGSCAYGTAVGWGAGQTQLNGYGTFIGYLAGQGITTGTYNTIVGTSAFNTGSGIVGGGGNTILGAQVQGLAAGLTNNIILANGTGTIKAQHDGTNWTFTGGTTITGTTTLTGNVISQVNLDKGSVGDQAVFGHTNHAYFNDSGGFFFISDTTGGGGQGLYFNATNAALMVAGGAKVNASSTGAAVTGTFSASTGGAAGAATCWKADAITLGHCTSVVGAGGTCTCV